MQSKLKMNSYEFEFTTEAKHSLSYKYFSTESLSKYDFQRIVENIDENQIKFAVNENAETILNEVVKAFSKDLRYKVQKIK